MEQDTIILTDALNIISQRTENNTPLPFSIVYRTFTAKTRKGGKLKSYASVKYLPEAKQKKLNLNRFPGRTQSKATNHFDNRTRNIELPDGSIRTVHIDFIISLNGKKVIY